MMDVEGVREMSGLFIEVGETVCSEAEVIGELEEEDEISHEEEGRRAGERRLIRSVRLRQGVAGRVASGERRRGFAFGKEGEEWGRGVDKWAVILGRGDGMAR